MISIGDYFFGGLLLGVPCQQPIPTVMICIIFMYSFICEQVQYIWSWLSNEEGSSTSLR